MPFKRALIVDDSKSARVILSRVLEKPGLAVDATGSAESALSYLREHRPDVIFMDHPMSGMDGLEALKAVKSDLSAAAIPTMMYAAQWNAVAGRQNLVEFAVETRARER